MALFIFKEMHLNYAGDSMFVYKLDLSIEI